jgi:hypothetical protein
MLAITSTRASAVTSLAEQYPELDLEGISCTNNLTEAFNKLRLNGSGIKKVKKVPQAPQLARVVASTPTRTSINDKTFNLDIERLADDISALQISKPARRLAKREAPAAHPYRRTVLTRAEKVLSSHELAKKGTVSTLLSSCAPLLMPLLCSAAGATHRFHRPR